MFLLKPAWRTSLFLGLYSALCVLKWFLGHDSSHCLGHTWVGVVGHSSADVLLQKQC